MSVIRKFYNFAIDKKSPFTKNIPGKMNVVETQIFVP